MRRRLNVRWVAGLAAIALVLLFAGANAHLVYVAIASQPDCVVHLKETGAGPREFRAAKSAC